MLKFQQLAQSSRAFGVTFCVKGDEKYGIIFSMNFRELPEKIIEYTCYALFFIVPIIWLPVTSELFEFNKMIIVYLATSVILSAWLFKSVSDGAIIFKRTPLDIPIILFLASNVLSTVFSIDRQTSIFGYYSRFNGGLLSTFAYITLYYALVTFFDKNKLFRLLKILLASSVLVSIYGILQHPTPLFRNPDGSFRGIDAGYWQEDAQSRAFSLGHANWLAAFILMLLPLALFFLTQAKEWWGKAFYTLLLIGQFLAFTFAYSRGGTVGFVTGLAVLVAGTIFVFRDTLRSFFKLKRFFPTSIRFFYPPNLGFFLILTLLGWFLTLYFFSNAFLSRGVRLTEIKSTIETQTPSQQTETQLTKPGTETGKIRLIVWKGAIDIFKHYPILGSGVETFAFSYYEFRPAEHNLTSEWDYLYNKAHNEFLNYLATTGSLGFFTYLLLIITFVIVVIMTLNQKIDSWQKFFLIAALASYTGYHAQNVFGFSVVAIALLFYLIPGFVFVTIQTTTPAKISLPFLKTSLTAKLARGIVLVAGALLVTGSLNMWLADYYYNQGVSTTNDLEAYKTLKTAVFLRPDEPLYKASLAGPTIHLATSLDGDERKAKTVEAFNYLDQAKNISPNNINIWQLRLSTLFELAKVENQYLDPAITNAEIIADLAPTQAEHQYNLAFLYNLKGEYQKAQEQLEKTVTLKPDYQEAWELLLEVDSKLKDEKSLAEHQKKYKQLFP